MEIAISGMGVVSTAGYELEDFWNYLYGGNISYGVVEEFNNPNYRVHIGAVIKDNLWRENLTACENVFEYGRASQYAASTVLRALMDANLDSMSLKDARIALCIGTTMGEVDYEEKISELLVKDGENDLSDIKRMAYRYSSDNIAEGICDMLNIRANYYMIPAACSGGNYAIALGEKLLRANKADIVIAGGVDVFSRVAFTGFHRLLTLSPDYCRPFDKKRRGLVIGEGCGFVVMEEKEQAKKRTDIHGYLLGVGVKSDRYHMVSPHPDGDGAYRAMKEAILAAEICKEDIDYISAHGTGTSSNDRIEALVLRQLFGEENIPPTSSIKSMLGHTMGAASILECIASLLMMEKGVMLPTVNLIEKDECVTFNCVPNVPEKKKMSYVMSNSFAFGGQVGSIILKGK